jgi:hypothetical protein
MRYRVLLCSLFLLKGPLAAWPVAAQTKVAGCFDLELGPWQPPLPGADSIFLGLPPRIELDTIHGEDYFTQSRGFALRPAPGAMPSVHRHTYWNWISPDSIRLVFSTGFSGLSMRLAVKERELVGIAQGFWDFPREQQASQVVATRVGCEAPLPENARARYQFPRGVLLDIGDSVRIGLPVPSDRLKTETVRERSIRILNRPAGLFEGAEAIEVFVTQEGIVRNIRLTYPEGADYPQILSRLEASLGRPTWTSSLDLKTSSLKSVTSAWSGRMIDLSVNATLRPDGSMAERIRVFMRNPR